MLGRVQARLRRGNGALHRQCRRRASVPGAARLLVGPASPSRWVSHWRRAHGSTAAGRQRALPRTGVLARWRAAGSARGARPALLGVAGRLQKAMDNAESESRKLAGEGGGSVQEQTGAAAARGFQEGRLARIAGLSCIGRRDKVVRRRLLEDNQKAAEGACGALRRLPRPASAAPSSCHRCPFHHCRRAPRELWPPCHYSAIAPKPLIKFRASCVSSQRQRQHQAPSSQHPGSSAQIAAALGLRCFCSSRARSPPSPSHRSHPDLTLRTLHQSPFLLLRSLHRSIAPRLPPTPSSLCRLPPSARRAPRDDWLQLSYLTSKPKHHLNPGPSSSSDPSLAVVQPP